MRRWLLLVLVVPLSLPLAAMATDTRPASPDEAPVGKKLYKWVDREGNVSYHDYPPPDESKYKVEERLVKGEKTPAKKAEKESDEPRPPVVLYTVPKCLSCDMARSYFQRRKVPFTEKNVEGNRLLLEELRKKTGSLSVPTILVGEKAMQGFLESLLAGELDAAGYPPEPPEKPAGEGKPEAPPVP
jgi:glutaredoxin